MREEIIEAMMRAMATSQGHSDEGNIGMLIDELDRTENNNRIILRAAATAALDAALAIMKEPSPEMIGEGFEAIRMEEKWPALMDRVWKAMLTTLEANNHDQ